MLPAIVISNHTVGLAVIRALGTMGVPIISAYYDRLDMGYVSKYVKKVFFISHPDSHETRFIEELIDCHRTVGRALLVPGDDPSLVAVSKHKATLNEYFEVACPEYDITQRLVDKQYTYALAERLGIAVPKTILPSSLNHAEMLAATVEFPCLIKPCQSHLFVEKFGKKLQKVHDPAEFIAAYQQAEAAGIQVMVQEYIPGDEGEGVNYNSYLWDGHPLVEFTASKVRISPPEFGVPSVVVSRAVDDVLEPGRKILQGMGYYGFSCAEFKRDPRSGSYKLLDVNARHNRSSLLAVNCGINFPWLQYRHLIEGELPCAREFRTGVYWIDEFQDLYRGLKELRRGNFSLSRYLVPYYGQHVYAVFDRHDMRPFFKRGIDLLGRVLKG